MMSREKRSLYNTINITDLITAQSIVEESRTTIEKTEKGMENAKKSTACVFLSIATLSVFGAEGFKGMIGALLITIFTIGWILFMIKAIISGGGILKILGVSWKVVYWSWLLVPIFPIDLFIAFMAAGFVIGGFFYYPYLYYLIMNKQAKKDLETAEKFIVRYNKELEKLQYQP